MSRYGRIRTLIAVTVIAMAATVWLTSRIQATADSDSAATLGAGKQMLVAMLDQETGLRGYINTRLPEFLAPYRGGRQSLDAALVVARQHATDNTDTRLIGAQVQAARAWQVLAEQQLRDI